jgi:C-terminal processing protease CtpA/Prc
LAPRITLEGLKVASVFADSPASESGIVPGDFIVAINGRTGSALNGPYLFGVFRQSPGTMVTLRILHGTIERDIELKLRDLL